MTCLTRANQEIRYLAESTIQACQTCISCELAKPKPEYRLIAIYADTMRNNAEKIENLPPE